MQARRSWFTAQFCFSVLDYKDSGGVFFFFFSKNFWKCKWSQTLLYFQLASYIYIKKKQSKKPVLWCSLCQYIACSIIILTIFYYHNVFGFFLGLSVVYHIIALLHFASLSSSVTSYCYFVIYAHLGKIQGSLKFQVSSICTESVFWFPIKYIWNRNNL